MNNISASVEPVVELENHIFIHPPERTGSAAAQCFHCGKTAEQHRWKSPRPWSPAEKEPTKNHRGSDE